VTAGHNNYYSETYPFILHNWLTPVFKALGVDFIVRNAGLSLFINEISLFDFLTKTEITFTFSIFSYITGLGNNPCGAYDGCPVTFIGDNVDIVSWEHVCYQFYIFLAFY